MRPSPDASPATAHGCLERLQRKGPITLHVDGTDRRVRTVEPTGPANAWFARLGQCLNLAARDG